MIPNTKIEPLKEYFDELSEHLKAHSFMLVVANEWGSREPHPKWTLMFVPTMDLDSLRARSKAHLPQEGTLAHLCWHVTTEDANPYPFIWIALTKDIQGSLLNCCRDGKTIGLSFRVSRRTKTFFREPIWT